MQILVHYDPHALAGVQSSMKRKINSAQCYFFGGWWSLFSKWGYKTDNVIFARNKDYAYMSVDIPDYCILLSHSSVPFILPKITGKLIILIPYDAL